MLALLVLLASPKFRISWLILNNAQSAQLYVNRLKRCLLIIRIAVIGAIAALAALVIFLAAASGLKASDESAFYLGVVITAGSALALLIATFITLLIAKITTIKLNKLDDREAAE